MLYVTIACKGIASFFSWWVSLRSINLLHTSFLFDFYFLFFIVWLLSWKERNIPKDLKVIKMLGINKYTQQIVVHYYLDMRRNREMDSVRTEKKNIKMKFVLITKRAWNWHDIKNSLKKVLTCKWSIFN